MTDHEEEAELWRDEAEKFAKQSRMYALMAKHYNRKTERSAGRAESLARIAFLMLGVLLVVQVGNFVVALLRRFG